MSFYIRVEQYRFYKKVTVPKILQYFSEEYFLFNPPFQKIHFHIYLMIRWFSMLTWPRWFSYFSVVKMSPDNQFFILVHSLCIPTTLFTFLFSFKFKLVNKLSISSLHLWMAPDANSLMLIMAPSANSK